MMMAELFWILQSIIYEFRSWNKRGKYTVDGVGRGVSWWMVNELLDDIVCLMEPVILEHTHHQIGKQEAKISTINHRR